MGDAQQVLGEAEVRVELHPSLGQLTATDGAARELHALVQRHLDDLLEDLKIPVQVRLTVTLAAEDVDYLLNETLFRITINGRPCRLELETTRTPTVSLVELSRWLAKEAVQNRDLFLTLPLCESVRDAWASEAADTNVADASAEGFRDLLLQLVQRGSSIKRATAGLVVDVSEQSRRWGFRDFESAVALPEATGIRVHLGKAQYERLVESNASARLTTDGESILQALETWDAELFRELGIVLPPVAVTCDLTLSDPDFRIQLNDIRLPPAAGLRQGQTFTACGPTGFIILSLNREIRRNAGHFLTSEGVKCSLDLLRDRFPVLVDTVLDRFDILELTAVLRDLLNEEVSIRDLRSVLESLLLIDGLGVPRVPPACGERVSFPWRSVL